MRCPTCKKSLTPPEPGQRSYAPFCSERCQLIDLGKWLDGKYQIAVEPDDRDELRYDDEPDGGRSAEDE